MSDELKMKLALLEAFAAEFADSTIGETYELTSTQQRLLSDGIRTVLAALAKREAVEVPNEMSPMNVPERLTLRDAGVWARGWNACRYRTICNIRAASQQAAKEG